MRIAGALLLAVFALVILNYQWLIIDLRFWLSRGRVEAPRLIATKNNQNPSGKSGPQEATAANVLSIPSLGITAPIVYADTDSETAFQEALINGVVHYPGTALPGQAGNVYIFGHSSDYIFSKGRYKTVFALLPYIKKGAEIYLSDGQGRQFTYAVSETVIAGSDDIKYLDQYGSRKKLLTVQTSYPVGTALRRFLAIAELKD